MVRVPAGLAAASSAAGHSRAVRTLLFRVAGGNLEGRVSEVDAFSEEVRMWQLVGVFLVKVFLIIIEVYREILLVGSLSLKQATESQDYWIFQYLVCYLILWKAHVMGFSKD